MIGKLEQSFYWAYCNVFAGFGLGKGSHARHEKHEQEALSCVAFLSCVAWAKNFKNCAQ